MTICYRESTIRDTNTILGKKKKKKKRNTDKEKKRKEKKKKKKELYTYFRVRQILTFSLPYKQATVFWRVSDFCKTQSNISLLYYEKKETHTHTNQT